ncbi:MAG: hypothetical protein A3H27_02695 [Acidobacteria bacterium RIFCSPLOWO2_02_FULL_59_13]|nr:MAG: hypothetical protein A3H27_02695 [Acidobacteria bacterium RIFCSPLOWO2_02_FULL_59_13]
MKLVGSFGYLLLAIGTSVAVGYGQSNPSEQAPSRASSGSLQTAAEAFPKDVYPDSGNRLPLVKREEMDEYGKKVYDLFVGPQTRSLLGLQGPYGIWLYSPRLGEHLLAENQYLRYKTDLGQRLTELAILVTARELDNNFEWTAHEPAALKAGLEQEIIDSVKYRKDTASLGEREALIIRFGRELFGKKKVSSDTFARAVHLFGKQGVVELTILMGNYASIASVINAFDLQLRPDQKPLLPMP